jgi:hypothetical protein
VTPFDLRPLAIGELLDRVFTLYRRHVSTFVGIMAVPSLFNLAIAVSILTLQHLYAPLLRPDNRQFDAQIDTPQLIMTVLGIAVGYVVFIVLYWIAYTLALGAATFAVSEIYAGREISIAGAFGRARTRVWRLMLLALLWMLLIFGPAAALGGIGAVFIVAFRQTPAAMLLGVLIVMVGAVVFLGAFIYLSLRYAMSAPALVLEGTSAPGALRRSAFLTRGYLGRVFLVSLVAAMLAYTAAMLLQMPFNVASAVMGKTSAAGFWLDMTGAVCGTIGHTLTAPVMVIGVAVLYYDLRVRKEALDLQVMLSALDGPGGGLPMTPQASTAIPN